MSKTHIFFNLHHLAPSRAPIVNKHRSQSSVYHKGPSQPSHVPATTNACFRRPHPSSPSRSSVTMVRVDGQPVFPLMTGLLTANFPVPVASRLTACFPPIDVIPLWAWCRGHQKFCSPNTPFSIWKQSGFPSRN